uniref:F-box only protein 9 n=1 Tax=Phallusia mammillata TaxID=59560 RepID=A0A6F9DDF9_9ASCI|nr:F-box only protein 9-like [Phallusia mammillata]
MANNFNKDTMTEEDALQSFREAWKSEVAGKKNEQEVKKSFNQQSDLDLVQKARKLFQSGIDCERNGKLQDAVQCYRRAIQLDPEIEQHMSDTIDFTSPVEITETDSNTDDIEHFDLVKKFSSLSASGNQEPSTSRQVTVVTQSLHINQLPDDVMIEIFRWVASSDLDLSSIETLSLVSRKFYLLARDPSIWHAACQKIWGLHTKVKQFKSWRGMFIERPQVRLDGVYISKVTYFRQGDPNLLTYTPFQCVEYYRYIRFFSNGQMLFYTTPDEPAHVVSTLSLENRQNYNFRTGQYKLTSRHNEKSAKITAILIAEKSQYDVKKIAKSRRRRDFKYIATDTQYFVDLEVASSSSKKRFNKISWVKYSCRCVFGGGENSSVTEYDLEDSFPPFYLSRVKSFNEYSHESL